MGTRSLTVVIDKECDGAEEELCVLYRSLDGYPSGHGKDLKEFLNGMTIGAGIPPQVPPKFANGASCLAAQIVAHFKTEPGEFYLYPAGTRDCDESYTYFVTATVDEEVQLKVIDDQTIYDGPISGFDPWLREAADAAPEIPLSNAKADATSAKRVSGYPASWPVLMPPSDVPGKASQAPLSTRTAADWVARSADADADLASIDESDSTTVCYAAAEQPADPTYPLVDH